MVLALVGGCASSTHAEQFFDLAVGLAPVLSAAQDLRGADLAAASQDLGRADLARLQYGDGGVCGPRINEVQTSVAGAGNWEFIEVYNPCGHPLDLDGWSLVYRSSTNVS